MNKVIVAIYTCIILVACDQKPSAEAMDNADTTHLLIPKPDTAVIYKDMHYFWEGSIDEKTNRLVIKRVRPLSADSLTQGYLIGLINDQYPDIKLVFVKTSNDTIFVKVRNSNFLTRQIGSSGADMYMNGVTYNLTELNNINYVNFSFKQGDHASPGTYSRTDFVSITVR